MELKKFDIVHEIRTGILLGGNLGSRTSRKIIDCFQGLPNKSILLIDITEANVIDYNFCSEAIGPLFKALTEGKFADKYMIVKVDPDQKINLLEGILWHIHKKKETKSSEDVFVENKMAIKLFNTQIHQIEFIGKLSELQREILNFINQRLEVDAQAIAKQFHLPVEDTINKHLVFLEHKYFIYKIERNEDYFYCSFCNSLKEGVKC